MVIFEVTLNLQNCYEVLKLKKKKAWILESDKVQVLVIGLPLSSYMVLRKLHKFLEDEFPYHQVGIHDNFKR